MIPNLVYPHVALMLRHSVMVYDIHLILDVLSIDIHAMQINHAPNGPPKLPRPSSVPELLRPGVRLRDVHA